MEKLIKLVSGYEKGCLFLFFLLSCNSVSMSHDADDIKVIAHRGASGVFPENTIAAIQAAYEMKVDFIEIDVHQTADKKVVVIHDKTVDRTTNGNGKVGELSIEYIRSLDAGLWKDKSFAGEKVPLLEEVFPFIDNNTQLLLEIKKGDDFYPGIEENILNILLEHNMLDKVIIQSFYPEVLVRLNTLNPELRLHQLLVLYAPGLPFHIDTSPRFRNLKTLDFVEQVNIYSKFAFRPVINNLRKNNFGTFVWTINEVKDLKKFMNKPINGIITDYPERMLDLKKD
ncbi:MAG: glycerophosphodiester phosphodiesterase [Chitinophagaceae bacterium]|nr:MAG: glycerophosphodiester phosphodiesterase [Chitinophagaceae bacterium]